MSKEAQGNAEKGQPELSRRKFLGTGAVAGLATAGLSMGLGGLQQARTGCWCCR